MFPKLALGFGLGVLVAAGVGWIMAEKKTQPQPVTIVVPAPAAPSVQTPMSTPPLEKPAPPAKPVKTAKVTKPVQASTNPTPEPAIPAPPPEAAPAPPPPPPVLTTRTELPKPEAPRILRPDRDAPAPPRQPKTVTIPAGTLITVRLREALSSDHNSAEDPFHATLDQPLVVDGFVIAERGSLQRGKVVSLTQAGRVRGRASLVIELTQLTTADGQKVDIQTDSFTREGDSGVKKDMARAGVAAGIGAAIGAIAGGGKGAAIGAAIGGAAGAGGAMATRGPEAALPSETRISFRLKQAVTLTERLG